MLFASSQMTSKLLTFQIPPVKLCPWPQHCKAFGKKPDLQGAAEGTPGEVGGWFHPAKLILFTSVGPNGIGALMW